MMNTRYRNGLIACGLVAGAIVFRLTDPAAAQGPLFVCDTYSEATTTPIKPPADAFLAASPDSAFSICRTLEGRTFYVEGTPPELTAARVCRYFVREVFQTSGGGWSETPPAGVMRYLDMHEKKALASGTVGSPGTELEFAL